MYRFVGVQRIEFTNDNGELIQGYSVHFLEHADRGVGWVPFKCFIPDDRYSEVIPFSMQELKSYAENLSEVQVTFGRRNRIQSIAFPGKK